VIIVKKLSKGVSRSFVVSIGSGYFNNLPYTEGIPGVINTAKAWLSGGAPALSGLLAIRRNL
jgi:hypothetical protein